MNVTHDGGRTLADTAAMAVIAGRSPWSVRAHCPATEGGYDVDACIVELSKHPVEPVLLTAPDAQRYLGVAAGTVRVWAHRGRLVSYARDGRGLPLYDAAVIALLAAK